MSREAHQPFGYSERSKMIFESALDRYAAENCDMRDPEVLRGLLEDYAIRKGDCQLGCLLYQASRMLEETA